MPRRRDGGRAGQAAAVLGLTASSPPVVELDARLLHAGPGALHAALAERLGDPAIVLVRDPAALTAGDHAVMRALPWVVAARAPVPGAALPAIDLLLPDDTEADRLRAGFGRAPTAATAAALLLREPSADWWTGLVRESTTYSMLQGSHEFRTWLARRPPPRPAGDPSPRVRVEHEGRVTILTLTRAARHNALDVAMRDELDAALAATPGPTVVLGDGPSFCSGGDLDEFGSFRDPARAHLVRLARSLAGRFAAAADRTVVGVHGAALGAGIELAAFARHVVAADDVNLGLPELGLGLIPGAGGTVSLPARVGRQRTLALLLTDGTIPGPVALEWGLVDEVVPRAQLRRRCLEIAGTLP